MIRQILQIKQEKVIRKKILNSLNIKSVLSVLKIQENKTELNKDICQTKSDALNENLQFVVNKLNFEESVFVYTIESDTKTIYSRLSLKHKMGHEIFISKKFADELSSTELSFLFGREIISLHYKFAQVFILLSFFYDNELIPSVLKNYLNLWNQYKELLMDMGGFYSISDDLNKDKIIALLKLQSDSLAVCNFSINSVSLDIRNMVALNFIENLNNIDEKKCVLSNDEFIQKCISSKVEKEISEIDRLWIIFLISTGLKLARLDNQESDAEFHLINNSIAKFFKVIPHGLINLFRNNIHIDEIIEESLKQLVKNDLAAKEKILNYLIELALIDNDLNVNEMQFIVDLATKFLDESNQSIAKILKMRIKKSFKPNLIQLF